MTSSLRRMYKMSTAVAPRYASSRTRPDIAEVLRVACFSSASSHPPLNFHSRESIPIAIIDRYKTCFMGAEDSFERCVYFLRMRGNGANLIRPLDGEGGFFRKSGVETTLRHVVFFFRKPHRNTAGVGFVAGQFLIDFSLAGLVCF